MDQSSNRFVEEGYKRTKITYLGIHEDELTREEILWIAQQEHNAYEKERKAHSDFRVERLKADIENHKKLMQT